MTHIPLGTLPGEVATRILRTPAVDHDELRRIRRWHRDWLEDDQVVHFPEKCSVCDHLRALDARLSEADTAAERLRQTASKFGWRP